MLAALFFLAACVAAGYAASRKVFPDAAWLFCVPVGIVFGTWAAYLPSLAIGFSKMSVIIASFILVCISAYALKPFKIRVPSLKPIFSPLPLFFTASFLAFLFLSTALLHYDSGGNLVGNGLDLGFYLSISSSVAAGNFPPEYPVISGELLSYHYFFFLFAGILFKAGLPLLLSYNLATALFLAALFSSFFYVAVRLFRQSRTALAAVLLLLFSGGLVFTAHLQGFDSSSPSAWAELLSNPGLFLQYRSYGYPIANMLTTAMVTKPDLAGMAIFLAILAFALAGKRTPHSMALAGLFAGLSGAFSLPAAAATLSFAFFYSLLFDRDRRWLWFFAAAAAALILSAHIYLPKLASSGQSLQFAPFWMTGGNTLALPGFWLDNLGIAGLLALAGLLACPPALRRVFIALLPAFAAFHFVSMAKWDVDNFKLVQPAILVMSLLAAAALSRIWNARGYGRPAAIALFALAAFSGYLSVVSLLHYASVDEYQRPICPASYAAMAGFVASEIPERAVFIADPQAETTCLTAIGGRLSFFTNQLWIENHGFDRATREEENNRMLAGDCALISANRVSYAYEDANRGWRLPEALKRISVPVYESEGLGVHKIKC
ncbi:MAG: hypothetical protein V1787_05170 [Candidatus Micrarchaeota archaeon]